MYARGPHPASAESELAAIYALHQHTDTHREPTISQTVTTATQPLSPPSTTDSSLANAHSRPHRNRLTLGIIGTIIALVILVVLPISVGETAGGISPAPALKIFDRQPEPADRTDIVNSTGIQPQTLRNLRTNAPLYAALDTDGNPCLLLVQPTGDYTASCAPTHKFPTDGVRLAATYPTAEADQTLAITARWLPDGHITISVAPTPTDTRCTPTNTTTPTTRSGGTFALTAARSRIPC